MERSLPYIMETTIKQIEDMSLNAWPSHKMELYDLANPLYKVVSAQGFEPRTHALEGRCSIQLSYAPTLYFKK